MAPPKLYDLTALQRDANTLLGFTAQQTLEYLQSLYEKELTTYPRTDSRYLTEDMANQIPALVSIANGQFEKLPDAVANVMQVIDNSKVSDHHAIIPTQALKNTDISALPAGELALLRLVCIRFICAVSDKHSYNETSIGVNCEGNHFTAKGKAVVSGGWKLADDIYRSTLKDAEKEDANEDDRVLPELSEGQVLPNVVASLHEDFTSPPKRFNEAMLLAAMESAGAEDMPEDAERKGLGTPATRAGIIERLIATVLIERKKKLLIPTDKGKNLIAIAPEDIKSPKLTADWEHRLKEIEHGETSDVGFLDGIVGMVRGLITTNAAPKPEFIGLYAAPDKGASGSIIGECPRCGSPVREGVKGFFCDNRACLFKLWKDNIFFKSKKKTLTKNMVVALLKDGRVFVSGLHSEKSGKKYDATVVMNDTGGKYVNFKLEFEKKGDQHEHKTETTAGA